jgi:hypothetical protein
VRIRSTDGKIKFNSVDKVASGQTIITAKHPMKEDIDFVVAPRPLKAILGLLAKDSEGDFHFGVSKEFWRIHHGKTDIWFPSLTQTQKIDQDALAKQIQESPSYMMKFPAAVIKECIGELAPLLSTSGKDDLPVVTLHVGTDKTATFAVNTSKVKDVSRDLQGAEIMEDRITLDQEQDVCINFKFFQEFVTALVAVAETPDPSIVVRWWPYQNPAYPVRGKTISIEGDGDNRFVVARVRRTETSV